MDFAVGQTCNSKWVIRLCRKDSKKDVKKYYICSLNVLINQLGLYNQGFWLKLIWNQN